MPSSKVPNALDLLFFVPPSLAASSASLSPPAVDGQRQQPCWKEPVYPCGPYVSALCTEEDPPSEIVDAHFSFVLFLLRPLLQSRPSMFSFLRLSSISIGTSLSRRCYSACNRIMGSLSRELFFPSLSPFSLLLPPQRVEADSSSGPSIPISSLTTLKKLRKDNNILSARSRRGLLSQEDVVTLVLEEAGLGVGGAARPIEQSNARGLGVKQIRQNLDAEGHYIPE